MPNFLKTLFKPPSTRSKRSTHPEPMPAEYNTPTTSPRQQLATEDLEALAHRLRQELDTKQANGPEKSRRHLLSLIGSEGGDRDETMKRLVELLEGMQGERVDPYPPPEGEGNSVQRAASMARGSKRGGGQVREMSADTVGGSSSGVSRISDGVGEWGLVMEACATALGELDYCPDPKFVR
jgi:hypothetical protein